MALAPSWRITSVEAELTIARVPSGWLLVLCNSVSSASQSWHTVWTPRWSFFEVSGFQSLQPLFRRLPNDPALFLKLMHAHLGEN